MGQLIGNTVHCLKTWSPFFTAVERGFKTFEVRRDDRGFTVGDVLILQEFESDNKRYTGNMLSRLVAYKLDGDQFGIEAGYCVLGLSPMPFNEQGAPLKIGKFRIWLSNSEGKISIYCDGGEGGEFSIDDIANMVRRKIEELEIL